MFEAQITKLKLIKRQMFGRAELDLLRARLMGTASAVGGPHGYFEFLEAWHDQAHEEHKAMRRWDGRGFARKKFDAAKATHDIARALERCRGGSRFRLEEGR